MPILSCRKVHASLLGLIAPVLSNIVYFEFNLFINERSRLNLKDKIIKLIQFALLPLFHFVGYMTFVVSGDFYSILLLLVVDLVLETLIKRWSGLLVEFNKCGEC